MLQDKVASGIIKEKGKGEMQDDLL